MSTDTIDQTQGFAFVQRLAEELSSGDLQLPTLPDVVMQLRRELAAEDFDTQRLARLLAAEPSLAARILALANSIAFRRGGDPIVDLRSAIARIGGNMVRNAAMSFALQQLKRAAQQGDVEALVKPEWLRATRVAAWCYALARRNRGLNPDEAMLAGLVHNTGVLYILSRAAMFPDLFGGEAGVSELCSQWHSGIGQSIVESWQLSESICQAVGHQGEEDPALFEPPTLAAVLTQALELDALHSGEAVLDGEWLARSALHRLLGLGEAEVAALLEELGPPVDELGAGLRMEH